MASSKHTAKFIAEIETVATLDVNTLWDRMRGEFLGEYTRLQREGLDPTEMERELNAFLDRLSDKPVEDLARRSSGVAYNQGRSAEILTASDMGQTEVVVRSEVLDTNTCGPCSRLDGGVYDIGSSDYYADMPPAHCLGGERCRGFYVVVAR
jgi:hypothetical protein